MKKGTSIFLLGVLFLLCAFCASGSEAEELIKKGDFLTLERCMEIALKMQPTIAAAVNTVNINESRVGQAESNYYPQISAAAGYTRFAPVPSTTSRLTGTLTHQSFNLYSGNVSLSQLIYDFGKTPSQVRIQIFNLDSSRSDLENTSELVILNVKQAYFGVLQAKRNRDVGADTVKQFQQHLEQAKGFYEVGTKPKFDVTKAEADLSNAQLNLIKAENALKLSIVILNNAMGIPDAQEYVLDDNLSFQKYNITFEDALDRAYKNRPDLISAIAKTRAAESSIELARTGYYPALTGSASYELSGETFPLEKGWNVGAVLSFPIFNGFLTKYQVEEAKANLNVLKANEELLRQGIFSDVQQAYLNLKQAEDSIPTAELGVKQAQENFEIATGRYAAGVGNPIEVTDAEVLLANAKLSYIQALYNYKVSQASLEKAMGMR